MAGVPDFGPDDFPEEEPDEPEAQPTSAERLLYALGQLYRRWHNGELPIGPQNFDVWELARTIGVTRDIEMVTDEPYALAFHFDGEVLVVLPTERFPWRIWNVEEWAFFADFEEYVESLEWD